MQVAGHSRLIANTMVYGLPNGFGIVRHIDLMKAS